MYSQPVLTPSPPQPIHPYTVHCYTLSACPPHLAACRVTPPSPLDRLQQPCDPERIISSDRKWMGDVANYTAARPQGVLQQWPFWWFIDLWLNTALMCGWLAPCNPCVSPSWARARRCRRHCFSAHNLVFVTFTPPNQTVNGMNTDPYMNYRLWQCQAKPLFPSTFSPAINQTWPCTVCTWGF